MPTVYKDGNYLTEKGRALIAKCMASKTKIEFTRAAVGSGSLPDGVMPKEMAALTEWRADGVIADISTPVPGEAQIVFQVFSRDISVGFLASEAGIWAEDPDEGEILYTYMVIDNNPEFIRAQNDPVQKFAEFTCISIVGSAETDLTIINPGAIVTKEMLDKLREEMNGMGQTSSGLSGRIDELETAQAGLGSRTDALETATETLETKVQTMEAASADMTKVYIQETEPEDKTGLWIW